MAATWTQQAPKVVTSVQAATEAAPGQPTDGFKIVGVRSLSIWLEAAVGQTITADTGQLDVWWYEPQVGAWGVAPQLVFPIPPGSAGQRRVHMGSVAITNPRGFLAPICNAIPVSAGSVTLYLVGE